MIANALLIAAAPQLHAERADLLLALKLLTRWVAKGIADDAYAECVAPERAARDLAMAEDLITRLDAREHLPPVLDVIRGDE